MSKDGSGKLAFNSKSIEIELEVSKSEYDNERERTSKIDNKTNIALPVIAGLFLFIAPLNNYKEIFGVAVNSFKDIIIPGTVFLSYTTALVFSLISSLFMIRVIFTKEYRQVNPRTLYKESYLSKHSAVISIDLIKAYIETTEINKDINDKRVRFYKKGWIFAIVSIIATAIFAILKNLYM